VVVNGKEEPPPPPPQAPDADRSPEVEYTHPVPRDVCSAPVFEIEKSVVVASGVEEAMIKRLFAG
jgi:hypothetical protein